VVRKRLLSTMIFIAVSAREVRDLLGHDPGCNRRGRDRRKVSRHDAYLDIVI
jgi:hypothetical protein